MSSEEKVIATIGCGWALFVVAWVVFLGVMLYMLVSWVVTK